MKWTLLVLAAAFTVLAATGCCLPLHGMRHGGHYYSDRGSDHGDRWSDASRPPPPPRGDHRRGYR